jgi:hypothetical protein
MFASYVGVLQLTHDETSYPREGGKRKKNILLILKMILYVRSTKNIGNI